MALTARANKLLINSKPLRLGELFKGDTSKYQSLDSKTQPSQTAALLAGGGWDESALLELQAIHLNPDLR